MSARRALHRLGGGALLALLLASSAPTQAQQAQPQVSAQASARRVEVGEAFTIQLKATGEQIAPNSPDLKVPAGLAVAGQSIAQFGTRFKRGIDIQWTVVAQRAGHFTIPGPSININQNRYTTSPIVIDVVAATPGSQAQRQRQSPFLFPGGQSVSLGGGFFADDPDEDLDPRETPTLGMPAAPDPWIFLRAVPDKKTAVIGEQITLSFYVYNRADYHIDELHEAPLADFRRASLLTSPGTEGEQRARAGAEIYKVRLLDRVAIFPLRAGELHTGSLSVKFSARRLGPYNERASDDQIITVSEPPRENRPPGYVLGDVGQFALAATVVPRLIEQGGSVAVSVRVTGSGTFPQELHLPERTGLEWLDPEKKEQIGVQNGAIAGTKSFGYVVRVKEAGKVDLGTIELSTWNPAAKRYEQSRAALGVVEVSRGAPGPRIKDPAGKEPDPPDVSVADPLGTLAPPRLALGAYSAARAPRWGDVRTLWSLIAAPPLLVGLAFAGADALRWVKGRRASVKESPAALAIAALREAEEAKKKSDVKGVAAAVE
ncbi:MAG: BatD family protein, partial [Minicystis sp.]